jgi:TolB protein
VWSPDGSRVLFLKAGPMMQEVWDVGTTSGEVRLLARCPSSCLDPFFGPDGHLYYSDSKAPIVWRIELDESGAPRGPARSLAVPVGGTIRGVSVAANGKVVAFSSLEIRSNLVSVAVDADGRPAGEPRVVTDDRSRRNTWPSISPDGQRIAYIAGRGGAAPDVWMVNRDGSEPTQMTVDRRGEGGPMWSADGSAIIFKTWRDGRLVLRAVNVATRSERDVASVDPASLTGVGLLDLQGFTLRATRDLSRVAFASLSKGRPNVFVVETSTMAARQVTDDREAASFPTLSPKGDRVAVQLYRDGDTHLAIVAAAGGPLRQVTSRPGQTWIFDWSPDGTLLSAATLRDGVWNVSTISAQSGVEQPLTREVTSRTYVRYPAWSPRGDFLVYERAEVTGNVWTSDLRSGATRPGTW